VNPADAIQIEFAPGTLSMIEELKALPYKLPQAIKRGMDRALPQVVSSIQAERLTGQGPFPVEEHRLGQSKKHGGMLNRSVRWTPAIIEGETVTGAIGDPVRYASVHEFGYSGQVFVPAFNRKVKTRDTFTKADRVSKKTGKGYKAKVKTASGITTVKAHTRWMSMPARAPFGHGIADNAFILTREITLEVRTDWEAMQS